MTKSQGDGSNTLSNKGNPLFQREDDREEYIYPDYFQPQ